MARLVSLFAILFIGVSVAHTLDLSEPSLGDLVNAIDTLAREFEGAKVQLNAIEARLTALERRVEKRTTSSLENQCWVRNIAESVRASNFEIAEQDLIALNNDDLIPDIVHDLYEGSSDKVDAILKFGRSLKDPGTRLLVFKALYGDMHSNGNSGPLKLIAVIKDLLMLPTERDEHLRVEAFAVIGRIVEDIAVTTIKTFQSAMLTNRFKNNSEVDSLAKAINDYGYEGYNIVMEIVIDRVFGVVATDAIIDNVVSNGDIQLGISGLTELFKRFELAGNFNSNVVLKLAYEFWQLVHRENYDSVAKQLRDDVREVVGRLPTCARNLFFAERVCLWNRGMNMSIYADNTSVSYTRDRRRIHMQAGEPKVGASWIAERDGTGIYFRRVFNVNEYLYPAGIMLNSNLRHVFAGRQSDDELERGAWLIKLDGDYCYFKSVHYEELLRAKPLRHKDAQFEVFTAIPDMEDLVAEYQWQLRDCSHSSM